MVWKLDFPAQLAGHGGLRFQTRLAVFATNAGANKKSIYAVTSDGRLAQIWDTNQWNLDFPAELAGHSGLRFSTGLQVFATSGPANKKSIYAITSDGRLAQIWDTNQWNLDFPAELAGQNGLRFQSSIAVFPTSAADNKKSIYAVTTDGRLAQIWDTNQWNLDFPAELGGHAGLRFQPGLAVFATNAAANKKSIYAVTTDGRLAQIWDTNQWNLDFPAELGGHGGLRFQPGLAVFATNGAGNKKSIYAVTTDGRLAQIWDTNQWNLDFPAELAGHGTLRFHPRPSVFPRSAASNKKSIFIETTDGRLAQVWDTNQWNLDFPIEQSASPGVRIQHSPAAFATSPNRNLKSIYAVAGDGNIVQVWDRPSIQLPFNMQAQQQSNWCWSAVTTSTSLFYNASSTWTQCTVANGELGLMGCCAAPVPAACNVAWTLNTALNRTGNLTTWQNGTISLQAIRTELQAGRPVAARIGWSGGGGHFVIIEGCDDDGILAIEDPANGASSVDIATFTSSYLGSGSWTHTYFTEA